MVRIIALLVILLVASAAQADWQYTKWGMSAAELEAFGQGNIVKASASSINPYNQGRSAGTTMAIDAADVVLTSGFKNEGITYDVLYYFSARGLFLVALIPKSVEDGLKTGKILDATYGARTARSEWVSTRITQAALSGEGGEHSETVISLPFSIFVAPVLNFAMNLSQLKAVCNSCGRSASV
jgi:hypothetical protein